MRRYPRNPPVDGICLRTIETESVRERAQKLEATRDQDSSHLALHHRRLEQPWRQDGDIPAAERIHGPTPVKPQRREAGGATAERAVGAEWTKWQLESARGSCRCGATAKGRPDRIYTQALQVSVDRISRTIPSLTSLQHVGRSIYPASHLMVELERELRHVSIFRILKSSCVWHLRLPHTSLQRMLTEAGNILNTQTYLLSFDN